MITVFSGGTGTPKLLQGLKEVVDPSELTIVVNTVENEYFSGVYVSADIDTVLYVPVGATVKINSKTYYQNGKYVNDEAGKVEIVEK